MYQKQSLLSAAVALALRGMTQAASAAATRTRIAAAALTVGALLGSALPASAAWEYAHGDSANTGFARVDTDPAASVKQTAHLGRLAPGANPVIGPDGTLYIGNLAGELRAYHADGTPYWTRQINKEHGSIFAAPVVGADGSIYVVSSAHYTDHRGGVTKQVTESFLHKFHPGGAWEFWRPFPEHGGYLSGSAPADGGATTAPPNLWRANGTEAIMVPVLYPGNWGKDLRLLAFSTNGAVLGDAMVRQAPTPETTGGSDGILDAIVDMFYDCLGFDGDYGCGFTANPNSSGAPFSAAGWQLPGVAIQPDPQRGAPFVVMSDSNHDRIVYAFSPQAGFSQVARSTHTRRLFTTPPVVQANGNAMVGTADGYLTFTGPGPNFVQFAAVGGLDMLTAAPTRLADGRLAVISRNGAMRVLSGNSITWQSPLVGESIASAAASCTHVFVATTDGFYTFDAKNMVPVAWVAWVGGGLAAPVIGPGGHVYAIASDTLYVFPPPRFGDVLGKTACDKLSPGFGGTLTQ